MISEFRRHDSAGGFQAAAGQKSSAMSSGEMTFSDYDADLQHEAEGQCGTGQRLTV